MELTSSVQRRAVALAISVASALLALITNEPSGLLVAVAAVCICVGSRAGLAAIAIGALLSSVTLLSPAYGSEDRPVRFVAFVVAAFGLRLEIGRAHV